MAGIGLVSELVPRANRIAAEELGDIHHSLAGGLKGVDGQCPAAGGDEELFSIAEYDVAGLHI